MRFLEIAALFFQFLVGGAQFLALDLQFLGMVLKVGTVAGRAQGDPHRRGNLCQEGHDLGADGMQEAQFDHAVDDIFGYGGGDDEWRGLSLPNVEPMVR